MYTFRLNSDAGSVAVISESGGTASALNKLSFSSIARYMRYLTREYSRRV